MLLILLTVLAADPLSAPTLTTDETKKLDASDVVVHPKTPTDGTGIAVEALGVIDAPTTEVWPVVRDCQYFSSFMPRTRATSLLEEDGKKYCHTEVAMPFPLSNLWSDTHSTYIEQKTGEYRREWKLVRGTYDRNSGSWTLIPWGEGGKQTLVVYALDTRPKLAVPDAIIRSAQSGSLPDVFKAIRKRVVELRK